METKQIVTWGAWGAVVIFMWFAVSTIGEIVERATSTQIASADADSENGTGFDDFSLADSALVTESTVQFHEFVGKHTTPFRDDGKPPPRVRRIGKEEQKKERPTLKIKGILEKENPLAVIEDPSGKTYICEAGDTVLEQRIVRISSKEVILNDKYGTYDLKAPEN